MSTEERDESQPRPKKVIPSIRRENTDQEGERRPYNQGYNKPEGSYERRPYRSYGENNRPLYGDRPSRPRSYDNNREGGYGNNREGAMVIVVHLMATIAMVGMEIIARLMATTVKVATTAAARLMEITARHMGMEEGNTIVRLVLIMMDRQRLIPLVLPERECLRMV